MFQLFSFIKFIFNATNQHGVHSPFVYDYVTKCLYKKNKIKLPICTKILVKTIQYFNYKEIRLLTTDNDVEKDIIANCPNAILNQKNPIVIVGTADDILSHKVLESKLHNRAMLFIDKIHSSKNNLELWNKIKEHHQVTVTIDLFYCGLVFVRKEQVKEHFKIRI